MSAQRAPESPSTANSLARDRVASLRTVQVPGSLATYANRATLRDLGLRWDPAGHRWHGTTTAAAVKTLREQLHLEVRVYGVLEWVPKGPTHPKLTPPGPAPGLIGVPARDASRRPHDGLQTNPSGSSHSRFFVPGTQTRLEPRIALPILGDGPEEFRTASRAFSLWETTSGLPDDSREEDEHMEARRLYDLRGRVRGARALVSRTPGLAETLARDWQRAARFYARFGITEATFQSGVAGSDVSDLDRTVKLWAHEVRA